MRQRGCTTCGEMEISHRAFLSLRDPIKTMGVREMGASVNGDGKKEP